MCATVQCSHLASLTIARYASQAPQSGKHRRSLCSSPVCGTVSRNARRHARHDRHTRHSSNSISSIASTAARRTRRARRASCGGSPAAWHVRHASCRCRCRCGCRCRCRGPAGPCRTGGWRCIARTTAAPRPAWPCQGGVAAARCHSMHGFTQCTPSRTAYGLQQHSPCQNPARRCWMRNARTYEICLVLRGLAQLQQLQEKHESTLFFPKCHCASAVPRRRLLRSRRTVRRVSW